jgi:hypothetical protein
MASAPGANYAFTQVSSNRKLGLMSVTMTDKGSCPTTCSFKGGGGCYAENFPLSLHWSKLDHAGLSIDELAANLKALPKHSRVRLNQAGDFAHRGGIIDVDHMRELIEATSRLEVIAYTHHDPVLNHDTLLGANRAGMVVNLSAESLIEADALADLAVGPVVVAVPRGTPKVSFTPKGRQVTVCPATYSDMTCDRCMICAKPERKGLIAFPSHGSGAKRVEQVFWAKQV